MIVLGWIFTILGTFLSIVGKLNYDHANEPLNSFQYYYDSSYMQYKQVATTIMIIGIVMAAVGIVLILSGYLRKNNTQKNGNLIFKKCLKCGHICNINDNFCDQCGNNLIAQGQNNYF